MTNGQHVTFADLENLLADLSAAAMDAPTRAALARAKRALNQTLPPGRTPIDDAAALRQVTEHVAQHGGSFHAAAKKVALQRHPFENPRSIAERYRRKRAKRIST